MEYIQRMYGVFTDRRYYWKTQVHGRRRNVGPEKILSSGLHTVWFRIYISQQVCRLPHPTAAVLEKQTCNLRPSTAALPLLNEGARLSRA